MGGRVRVEWVGLAVVVVLLVAGTGFLVSPDADRSFSPVAFEDTLTTGMTGVDVRQAESRGWSVPRAQAFYAQYEYVVGYYGMEALVEEVGPAGRGTYGRPLAVFVTDYSGTAPELTDAGYLTLGNDVRRGWARASGAHFVVDSAARTPAGSAVIPFGDRADATTFADRYGGAVVDWAAVKSRSGDQQPRGAALRERVDEQHAWANRTVAETRALRDRPVSVVVGEDAPTLEAALAQAEANETIRLPPGTYDGPVTVTKPVTLAGAGNETVVDGNGTGSVLTVRSPRVAVTDLRVTGVGDRDLGNASAADNGSQWDRRVRLVYGEGDAGIRMADAHGSRVADVTVDTPSNGIVLLNSSATAVTNVTVRGTDDWGDGFMGVLAMYSRVVVQDSAFRGGRDGVYTHYADGLVARDNTMRAMRYGVHEMYTSDTLVADNSVRETQVGVVVMTRPRGNLLVGNDVRDSGRGVSVDGSTSLVARNVLADNGLGLSVGADRSVVTHNSVVRNEVGVRDGTLLPTNDIFGNDILANGRAVEVAPGSRDTWAVDGRGNYWGTVPGRDRDGDGVVDRPYRPTDTVDAAAGRSAGAATLADSPSVAVVRGFQRAVPGLRAEGAIDPSPLARPVRPEVLDRLGVKPGGDEP
ncbi:MAG: NosD domain-containing protein [Haloarculaceae archaeon]